MTLGEWIRANAVNADGVENLITLLDPARLRRRPERAVVPLRALVRRVLGRRAHTGTFSRNSDTANGAQERRFVGGSQLVPLRLARQLGDVVALRAPVHRIVQTSDHARACTPAAGRVRAKRVIVAAPPPTVLDIDFHPGCPPTGSALLDVTCDMGQLMKCDAIYETPFWRDAGLNGFGISDHGAVRAAFDNCPPDGEPGRAARVRRRLDLAAATAC